MTQNCNFGCLNQSFHVIVEVSKQYRGVTSLQQSQLMVLTLLLDYWWTQLVEDLAYHAWKASQKF